MLELGVRPSHCSGFLQLRVAPELRFDFTDFDSVSAYLHLIIDAAKKFNRPVIAVARQVARSIQPVPGRAEGVRPERRRRQIGSADVTATYPHARHA